MKLSGLLTLVVLILVFGTDYVAAQKLEWQRAPRMTLERQFAGPLMDTIIQRLRDPVDGSVCYVYLPISASHTEKTKAATCNTVPTRSARSVAQLPPTPCRPRVRSLQKDNG